MPRGDGNGPMGAGPRSGRAAGYCAGYGMPGYANPFPGRGLGMGRRGGGRGFRRMFYAAGQPGWMRFGWNAGMPYAPPAGWKPDPETEKQALQNQAQALQTELEDIKKRLSEIETGAAAE